MYLYVYLYLYLYIYLYLYLHTYHSCVFFKKEEQNPIVSFHHLAFNSSPHFWPSGWNLHSVAFSLLSSLFRCLPSSSCDGPKASWWGWRIKKTIFPWGSKKVFPWGSIKNFPWGSKKQYSHEDQKNNIPMRINQKFSHEGPKNKYSHEYQSRIFPWGTKNNIPMRIQKKYSHED